MPSMQDKLVRDQIVEASKLADIAKTPIAGAWSATRTLPADNAAAGLPPVDRIVGNYVTALAVQQGDIVVTFGNLSNRHLEGRKLSLRAATVDGYPQVPIAWVCGRAGVPGRMQVRGADRTTLDDTQLPLDCRAGPAPAAR
jgi:type IV pilus assembly protein PilA